jgi:hypothetical protein
MENKRWDFGDQTTLALINEQLTWSVAGGQRGSYPLQSVTSADYEEGGFLRLTTRQATQLIPLPQRPPTEHLVREIKEYVSAFQQQVRATSTPPAAEASTSNPVLDELAKLEHLKTIGFLTEEEFQQLKHKLQL